MAFEKTKTIRYNGQGAKIEERTTYKENSVIPIGVPHSFDEEGNPIPTGAPEHPERSYLPTDSEVRYAYRYDSYGNWTEKTTTYSDESSLTTRRELTYY